MTFLEAALEILKRERKPLHYKELTERAMDKKLLTFVGRTPEVTECVRVTGEDCFVMRAHVRDVTHLEELIDRFVIYGQTTTSIVQSAPVPGRGLSVGLD